LRSDEAQRWVHLEARRPEPKTPPILVFSKNPGQGVS
jgi:hypothetical protein